MEKIYITEEEKKELTDLGALENKFIIQLGEIEYQLQELEEQKAEIKKHRQQEFEKLTPEERQKWRDDMRRQSEKK